MTAVPSAGEGCTEQGFGEYILLVGCSMHVHRRGGAGGQANNYEVVAIMQVGDNRIQP